MFNDFVRLAFGRIEQEPSSDAPIVLDGLEEFLFLFFAHAREFANLSFAREFGHSLNIAYLIGAPDQRDSFRSQPLYLQAVRAWMAGTS